MRALFLCIIILLSFQFAKSQIVLRPQVGATFNTFDDVKTLKFDNKLGYVLGADLLVGNQFYFHTGIFYEVIKNEVSTPVSLDFSIRADRMRIPAQLGVRLFKEETSRMINLRAFTGPTASIVINSDIENTDVFKNIELNDLGFGWNAGIGLDILFAFFDLNYMWGLSDAFDRFEIQNLEAEDTENRTFYLTAGLKLKF